MRQLHAFPAQSRWPRYRARAFNSDCYPFETGRSAVRVRARNRYLPTSDSSNADGSCSLPPRRLISLLSDICAHVLASASTPIAEHFRQLLDPVLSASGIGIEIEGLGQRLVRDAHAEPHDDILTTQRACYISTDRWRSPPMTLPWFL
jgi:hypothetical protein